MSDATETVSVKFEVIELERVQGCGRLLAMAHVRCAIADVEIELRGCRVVSVNGRAVARGPAYRDPKSGQWADCLVLPQELSAALGAEINAAFEETASV
jgi:hypothetical protein